MIILYAKRQRGVTLFIRRLFIITQRRALLNTPRKTARKTRPVFKGKFCAWLILGIPLSSNEALIDKPVSAGLVRGHIIIPVRISFDRRQILARVFR